MTNLIHIDGAVNASQPSKGPAGDFSACHGFDGRQGEGSGRAAYARFRSPLDRLGVLQSHGETTEFVAALYPVDSATHGLTRDRANGGPDQLRAEKAANQRCRRGKLSRPVEVRQFNHGFGLGNEALETATGARGYLACTSIAQRQSHGIPPVRGGSGVPVHLGSAAFEPRLGAREANENAVTAMSVAAAPCPRDDETHQDESPLFDPGKLAAPTLATAMETGVMGDRRCHASLRPVEGVRQEGLSMPARSCHFTSHHPPSPRLWRTGQTGTAPRRPNLNFIQVTVSCG